MTFPLFQPLFILIILSVSWTTIAYRSGVIHHHHSRRHQWKKRSTRYFKGETQLSPLLPTIFTDFDDTSNHHHHRLADDLHVVYTNDPAQVSHWLADHVPSVGCTLGFDVESVPNVPWIKPMFYGPAVVQLASAESAVVIQLARRNGRFSKACLPLLEAVLSDDCIVKAGCGIENDMLELKSTFPQLQARSRFDLCSLRSNMNNRNTPGLKSLASSVLGVDLPKSRKTATSDWSRVPLSHSQVAYAARDAWAGAAIVQELATRDPDTFGNRALMHRLRFQRSVSDLHQRRKKRKQAKVLLSSLLSTPSSRSQSDAATTKKSRRHTKGKRVRTSTTTSTTAKTTNKNGATSLPQWKIQLAQNLREVVQANKHEHAQVLDMESLGVLPASNRTVI